MKIATAKKQPSRKGKKAWRQNVDIKQIEKQLDEKRTEDISGDIKTRELFVIDTAGSKSTLKPLRIDQILKPTSAIPSLGRPLKKNVVEADVRLLK
jgi:nucleolar protein 53